MRRFFLILTATLAFGGCATLQSQKVPVCDGKNRRPANLHGSVLSPAGPAMSAPAKPDQLSAAPLAVHGRCSA